MVPSRVAAGAASWKARRSVSETYDTVISLGSRCQVAHQLRRKYPHSKSQFFDWLITPDEPLLQILCDGMTGFADDISLSLGASNRETSSYLHVVEGAYGTLLSHDFNNDGVDPNEQWKSIKGKYQTTTCRFHEALDAGKRVLFLRMSFGQSGSMGYDADDRADLELGEALRDRIDSHWPELDYDLMLISHHPDDVAQQGNLEIAYMPEQLEWNWQGKDADWDALLDPRVRMRGMV